jgi:hypothetical protein
MSTTLRLSTVNDLREHVLRTLCAHEDLDPRYTPIRQSVVQRHGKPCGLFFHIQGPRLLKAYAVWSAEEGRILFYDALGERFAEAQLSEGPDPALLAA